jgi:hypothetical protein
VEIVGIHEPWDPAHHVVRIPVGDGLAGVLGVLHDGGWSFGVLEIVEGLDLVFPADRLVGSPREVPSDERQPEQAHECEPSHQSDRAEGPCVQFHFRPDPINVSAFWRFPVTETASARLESGFGVPV